MPLSNSLMARLDTAGVAAEQRRKWNALYDDLAALKTCLVAYSGGADSAFLAFAASRVRGLKSLAVTVESPLAASGEIKAAAAFAARYGIPFISIALDPLAVGSIRANPVDRCYHCKKYMLENCRAYAAAKGFRAVLVGENADDLHDHRPGLAAVEESGTLSPLAALGFTKNDIRAISRAFGLSTWDKPASPCLATRIPYGTPIMRESLERITRAECYLREKGFSITRVRCHGNLACVEVDAQRVRELSAMEEELSAAFQMIGFVQTRIDSRGYRSGSLDEGINL